MEDEADIYDGMRAQFPLTFGKQAKAVTPLEVIHNTTRRTSEAPPTASASSQKALPSLSSSSKAWLDDLRAARNPNPSYAARGRLSASAGAEDEEQEDDGPMVGPPRPPLDEVGDGDVLIGPPRPPVDGEDGDDEEMIGPPRPPPGVESDSDDEVVENSYRIPLSNEIVLKGHTKVVAALAVDHSGSRVLSGSYDYTVRMFDFQGMNSKLASFRQLEPFEGHQVRSLSWSPTADRFLCVTGSAQAKIYDRDGLTLGEFVKGDMYIRDLKNTKGHISGLTCGQWHPSSKETILTSSEDGSLRIWDVSDFKGQKQV